MAFAINDECVDCGVCVDECPVEAITEGADKTEINVDLCTDCGICFDECPVEAIIEE